MSTAIAGYSDASRGSYLRRASSICRSAHAHRALGENEEALVAYQTLLDADPENEDAKAEIERTRAPYGRFERRDRSASGAPSGGGLGLGLSSSKEDFYNLGELAFANGAVDRAQEWFEKATGVDPTWVKPWFKLALVALNKGDIELAKEHFRQVVELDPGSQEGAQAQATLAALP